MNLIILGSNSDIAKALEPMFTADGWEIQRWHRDSNIRYFGAWDAVLVALGQVAPIGNWWDLRFDDCMESNFLLPMRLLKTIWPNRKANASVCFMAGSNPNKIMRGYAPYHASKMALVKNVEQLDVESPDCKFFALAPGYVDTKIHKATLEAGWPNERIAKGSPARIEDIYKCLSWCLAQPKEIVGGRNICATDNLELLSRATNPNLYKLRRVQ